MRTLALRFRRMWGPALLVVAGLVPSAAGQSIIGFDPNLPSMGSFTFSTQSVGPDSPSSFPQFSNGTGGLNPNQLESIGGPVNNAFPLLSPIPMGNPNSFVLASGAMPLGSPPFAAAPALGGVFGGGALGAALFAPPPALAAPPPIGLTFFTAPTPLSPVIVDGAVDGIASTAYGNALAHFTTTGGSGNFLTAVSYLAMTPPGGVSQLALVSTINPTTIVPGAPPAEGATLREAEIVGGDDMNPGHAPAGVFKAFSAGVQVSVANAAGGTLGAATTMSSGLVLIGITNLPTEYRLQSWLTVSVDPGAQVRPAPFTDDQILAMYPGSSSATQLMGMNPVTTYHWTNAAYRIPGEDGDWGYLDGNGAKNWNYLALEAPTIPTSGYDVYFDNTGIMNSTTAGVGHVKFETATARSLLFIQSAGPYMIDGNSAAFKGPLFVGNASGGSIESWTAQPVTFNEGVNIKAQFDLVLRTTDPSGVMTFNCPITPQTAGMQLNVETDGLGRTILNDTTSQIALLRIHNGTTEAVPGAVPPKVDVVGGALEIHYAPQPTPDAAIRAKLIMAYAGGTWAGNSSIGSGTAAADPARLALGYADGADGLAANLPAGFERIMLTHPGDANLDGKVDFSDLLIVAQHYGLSSGARWDEGDFNYDGAVGFDDLLLLAQNYAAAVDPPAPPASTVPEPVGLAAVILAASALRRRPRECFGCRNLQCA